MFELYRDNHLVSRKPTREEVAEDLQPGPDHSAVYEIIDRTDTPEGILVSRVAVLRSTAGWLTYDLTGLPEPLPNKTHVHCMLDAANDLTLDPGIHPDHGFQPPSPSLEWCPVNNCHLSECALYPDCRGECGHT